MDNEAVFQEYEKLAKRIKAGDDSAFSEMYEKSSRLVYGTCYGILRNEDDARDAMQETYLVCYQKIGELDNDKMFLSWLKRIAATRSLNLYKKNHGDISYDDAIETEESISGDDDLENLPDTWILQESEREVFRSILRSSLSEVQYQTILLYYFSELPVEAIAEVMQCPVGTVKTRLKSARIKIKEGVEMYEEKTGEKMKVAMAVPFLGRFFQEEFKQLVLPPVDPALILAKAAESYAAAGVEAVTGTSEAAGSAAAGSASGATAGGTAGAASGAAGSAAGAVGTAGAASAAGAAKASFLSTLTGKIVVLVSAIAILVGGGILINSVLKKKPEEKKKNPKIVEKSKETEEAEETEKTEDTEDTEEGNASSAEGSEASTAPAGSENGASSDSGAAVSADSGLSGETDGSEVTALQTYNQVGKVAVSDLPQADQLSWLVSIFKSEYDHTDIPDDFVRNQLVTSEYGARLPFEYYFKDFERGTGFTDPEGNFDKTYCGRIYMPFLKWAEEYILNISEADRERINAEERFEVVAQTPTNRQGAYIGTDDFLYFWQGGTGNTESTTVIAASFDGEYYTIYASSYDDFDVDDDFDPARDGIWRKYTMKLVEVDGSLYWSVLDCHMMQEHDESVLLSDS